MQTESVALQRRQLGEQNLEQVAQLDGQFDTNVNEENDEMMLINNTDTCIKDILNPGLPADVNYMPELPLLLRLSWDDVLYTSLIPLLSIEDMFRLRGTSTGFRVMIDGYFAQLRTLDISSIGSRFTTNAFKVSFGNVYSLLEPKK